MESNKERKERELYEYKKENTLNAAIEYAYACERFGAVWDVLTIIRFCRNTFPEMTVADAIDIAQAVRGRYIK